MEGIKAFGENLMSMERTSVQAIQLKSEADLDNFLDAAEFCNGEARCIYQGRHTEHQSVVVIPGVNGFATEGQWIVAHLGSFIIMEDVDFRTRYDTVDHSDIPEMCEFCLSRVESTPLADPGETACPECGVAYQGERRTEEYNILLAAGLVRARR